MIYFRWFTYQRWWFTYQKEGDFREIYLSKLFRFSAEPRINLPTHRAARYKTSKAKCDPLGDPSGPAEEEQRRLRRQKPSTTHPFHQKSVRFHPSLIFTLSCHPSLFFTFTELYHDGFHSGHVSGIPSNNPKREKIQEKKGVGRLWSHTAAEMPAWPIAAVQHSRAASPLRHHGFRHRSRWMFGPKGTRNGGCCFSS